MWTRFIDMHSGGRQKLSASKIYIEADMPLAAVVFVKQLGRNPYHVTCYTCGEDYSISTPEPTFAEASAFDRGCHWDKIIQAYIERPSESFHFNKYKTVDEFAASDDVIIIKKDQITVTADDLAEGYINSLREWWNDD